MQVSDHGSQHFDPWYDCRRRERLCHVLWATAIISLVVSLACQGWPAVVRGLFAGCVGVVWLAWIAARIWLAFAKCPACGRPFFRTAWRTSLYTRRCLHCGVAKWSAVTSSFGRLHRLGGIRHTRGLRTWLAFMVRSGSPRAVALRRLLRSDRRAGTIAGALGGMFVLVGIGSIAVIELERHVLLLAANRGQPAAAQFDAMLTMAYALIWRHAPIAAVGGLLLSIAGRDAVRGSRAGRYAICAILLASIVWLGFFAYDAHRAFGNIAQWPGPKNGFVRVQVALAPILPVVGFAIFAPAIAALAFCLLPVKKGKEP